MPSVWEDTPFCLGKVCDIPHLRMTLNALSHPTDATLHPPLCDAELGLAKSRIRAFIIWLLWCYGTAQEDSHYEEQKQGTPLGARRSVPFWSNCGMLRFQTQDCHFSCTTVSVSLSLFGQRTWSRWLYSERLNLVLTWNQSSRRYLVMDAAITAHWPKLSWV